MTQELIGCVILWNIKQAIDHGHFISCAGATSRLSSALWVFLSLFVGIEFCYRISSFSLHAVCTLWATKWQSFNPLWMLHKLYDSTTFNLELKKLWREKAEGKLKEAGLFFSSWKQSFAFFVQVCFIGTFLDNQTLTSSGGYVFPDWAYKLGWTVALSSVVPVPTYAVIRLVLTEGTFRQVRARIHTDLIIIFNTNC